MLSNNGLCLHSCALHVSTFSTGGKFKFYGVHTPTLASHSCALLAIPRKRENHMASFFQFPYVRECVQALGSTDGNKPCCLSYRHSRSTSCDRLGNLKRAAHSNPPTPRWWHICLWKSNKQSTDPWVQSLFGVSDDHFMVYTVHLVGVWVVGNSCGGMVYL